MLVRSQTEAALERLTALLASLGLEPKAAKTRIVKLQEEEEGARGSLLSVGAGQLAMAIDVLTGPRQM